MKNKLEQHLLNQNKEYEKGKNFFWHRLRSKCVIDYIKKYKRKDPVSILDVGAGAGVFSEHLKEHNLNSQYNFVEPFNSLASQLEKKVGVEANKNSAQSYHDMDFLILMDVLEHQENDLEFLINLKSKMRRDSYLIITCPAMMFLWSDWDKSLGHFRRYSLNSFNKVIKEAGFEIVNSHYLFQAMIFPGLLRKNKKFNVDAEFPDVSKVVNSVLYYGGVIEQKLCSFLPFGSSIVAVAKT